MLFFVVASFMSYFMLSNDRLRAGMGPLEECRSTQSPEVVPVSDPFPPAKARMRAELFPNPVALSFILSIHHF